MKFFENYDFDRPRSTIELHPVRTMDVTVTGDIFFPMKKKYDLLKRTVPLTIICPATSHGSDEDAVAGEKSSSARGSGDSIFDNMIPGSGVDRPVDEATKTDDKTLVSGEAASSGGKPVAVLEELMPSDAIIVSISSATVVTQDDDDLHTYRRTIGITSSRRE